MFTNEETRAMAQEVLDYINEHPETHDQSMFFYETSCGTTMCIAGTTLFVKYGISSKIQFINEFGIGCSYSENVGPLLGLEGPEETDRLFYEMNNERAVQKLKHIVTGDLDALKAMNAYEDE